MLALEYNNHKKEETTPVNESSREVQTRLPEKFEETKREYFSFNDYFGDVYNWLRTRKENEKVYHGIYNSNGNPMKLSLSIS